jgi:CHAT domain-containing protein/Tfp pilus assembly protein PilF
VKKSLETYERSLSLWRLVGDEYEQGLVLSSMGLIYQAHGNPEEALRRFKEAVEIDRGSGDKAAEIGVLFNEAASQADLSNEDESLKSLNEALSLSRSIHDKSSESTALNDIGSVYDRFGKKSKALEYYDQALPLAREIGDRAGESSILHNTGLVYIYLGDGHKALNYLNEAVESERLTHDKLLEGATTDLIGIIYKQFGEKQKALEYLQRALSLARESGDRSWEGSISTHIGEVYDDLGEKEKALNYYQQALPLLHSVGSIANEAMTLSDIGVIYFSLGEEEKALDYYRRALAARKTAKDLAGEATTMHNIALVYNLLGKKDETLQSETEALELWRSVNDPRGTASALDEMGHLHWTWGDGREALSYYEQGLSLRRSTGDRGGEATTLLNMALVYSDLGDEKTAIEYFAQALPIKQAVSDRSGEGAVLDGMGMVYNELGQKDKALDCYGKALSLARAVRNPVDEAAVLNNIAIIDDSLGKHQEAMDLYNQALSIEQRVGNVSGQARTTSNMGTLYDHLGEKRKALDFLDQALLLRRKVGDRPGEAATLNSIGVVNSSLGNSQQALQSYNQALYLFRLIENPLAEGNVLGNLMRYWVRARKPSVAVLFGKNAVNRFQDVRGKIRDLDKDIQKTFAESKAGTYRELADLLIGQGRLSEAEEVLDLLKEEEYFEFIRRDGRSADSLTKPVALTPTERKSYDEYEEIADEVIAIDVEWSALRAKSPRTPDQEQRYSELSEKLKVANDRMERYFADLYKEFDNTESAKNRSVERILEDTSGAQSLVRDLGPGTLALYTLVTETKYRVIVISSNAMQPREYAITQSDLRRKVAALLTALENPKSDPLAASQELYKIVIGPIEKDLRGAKATTLMWSLDDVLRYVPIAALNDGKQYLVENYRNVVFTPASVGRLKDQPEVKNSRGLAMGISKDYDGLGPLPQVPNELRGIIRDDAVEGAKGVIPGTMMLDDSFTEKNMAAALEQHRRLVHIASHFVLQPGNESDSYLLLGGKDEGGKGYHLTLQELRTDARLTFGGTDLLTLSACQTARGGSAADGHEVDALGMLAQRRGAKAVMATLWSVNDESTGWLMTDFYRRWVDNPLMSKGEALRQAQVAMLHSKQTASRHQSRTATRDRSDSQAAFTHPYFWAPFILIGNWK